MLKLSLLKRLPNLKIHPAVQQALFEKNPIVALESTIITHGLPHPENYECATSLERIVRSEGATPATIAVIRGTPKIGLNKEDLEFLSECQESIKAGKRDLPFAIQDKLTAGTTVSGTMLLARQAGIEIFATGGIGGVHRGAIDGANPSFDISSDLTELSCNSVMVVCAGIKSILDIPRTLEYLETLAVPVATLSNLEEVDFPAFYFNESGIKSFKIAHGPNHAADYWLKIRDHLNMNTGFLLAVPPDALSQAEQDLLKLATNQALDLAAQQNISGKEATPFLLEQINQISKGLSLKVNIRLIEKNASMAAQIASAVTLKRKNFSVAEAETNQNQIPTCLILGASNLDIYIKSQTQNGKFQKYGASNPVETQTIPGGVGRNLTEAYSRCLDPKLMSTAQTHFISPVGNDIAGQSITRRLRELNVSMLPPIDNFSTGTYSSVFNGDGSIELAGADMKISDNFDLEKNLTHEISQTIQNTRLVIADLNLKPQLLHKIYSQFDPAVIKILDPTSIFKCHKIFQSPNLSPSDFFDIITPNLDEFVALLNLFGELEFGDQFDNEWSVDEFIYGNNGGVSGLENLNLKNILTLCQKYFPDKIILLTMDQYGILLIDQINNQTFYYPVHENILWNPQPILNVSGSGDTFTGALSSVLFEKYVKLGEKSVQHKFESVLSNENLDAAVKFGLEAAQYSLRCNKPVSDKINKNLTVSDWKRYEIKM